MIPRLLLLPFALFFLQAFCPVHAQELPFVVKGTLPASAKKYKVLLAWNGGASAEEATVVNGRFVLKGKITEPGVATLELQDANPPRDKKFDYAAYTANQFTFFLDSGTITITTKGSLSDAVAQGSAAVNAFQQYQQQVRPLKQLENQLGATYYHYALQKKEAITQPLMRMAAQMSNLYLEEQKAFVARYPESPVSLHLVKEALGIDLDVAKAEPLYQQLSTTLQQSTAGKALQEQLELGRRSMVGAVAPVFVQPDENGNPVSLETFRGKYVLVDFWASWCAPCRAESPTLVKVYRQYNAKGFEIFSVTLDGNRERWLKAIKEDGYTWKQAGDLKGWENEAARLFGIQAIPFNFLLDPNGVVVARNLRGEELERKLQEIFK